MESKDAAEQIKTFFSYWKDPNENPAVNPSLFQPCCSLYPGCCRSEAHWSKVIRMVQQFEICLENNKESMCQHIMNFHVCQDVSEAQSSRYIPDVIHNSWHVMGCVGKRPLVHVLGTLQQQHDRNILVPHYVDERDDKNKHWSLQTSHKLFRSIIEKCADQEMSSINIRIRLHSFDAIGSLDIPNHFRVSSCCNVEFTVGTNVVVARNSLRQRPTNTGKVELGFGFSFEPSKPKTHPKTRESKRKDAETDTTLFGCISSTAIDDEGAHDCDSKTVVDISKLSVLEKIDMQDSDPSKLDDKTEQELVAVVKQLSCHEEEVEARPADEISTHSKTNSNDKLQVDKPAGKTRFSLQLGITNLQPAKRNMVCFNCNQSISKGDHRFEHFFSLTRPPRSIHPECAGNMAPEALQPSIVWLQNESRIRTGTEHKIILKALDVVGTADKLCQSSGN